MISRDSYDTEERIAIESGLPEDRAKHLAERDRIEWLRGASRILQTELFRFQEYEE